MTGQDRIVTVFGTSRAKPQDSVFKLAFETGMLLAQNGFTLANGGYGGTMLASAKGACSAGGKTIGVICSAFGRSDANEYITETISTSNLDCRLDRLVELGDAYIVLPGGTGTLLELAHVWEHKNKNLANTQKPIIIMTAFWKGLVDLMAQADRDSVACIEPADSAQEAIDIIKKTYSK